MATAKQLEKQFEALTKLLAQHGIREPGAATAKSEKPADFIGFGTPEHMTFIGIVEVDNIEEAEEYGYLVYRSKKTNVTYRLEDQVTPFMQFPDPTQVARLVLRQKVSSFESGQPKVPADAPPLWRGDLVTV